MSGLGVFLILASLFGFFLGIIALIAGKMTFLRISNRKQAGLLILACFLLFVITGFVEALSTNTSTSKTSLETKPEQSNKADQYTEQQKNDFKSWYDNLMASANKPDEASKTVGQIIQGVANGNISKFQAYSSLKDLKEVFASARRYFYSIKPPDSLSKNHKQTLKEATEALATAQFCREEGINNTLKFLDEPKPSYLDKAKEEFNSANTFLLKAMTNLLSVQTDLGLMEKPKEEDKK